MIRVFTDGKGNYAVQTTCLDTETFVADLAEVIAEMKESDGGISVLGVLSQAMPIAFKLSGYKAELVQEHRTLYCGAIAPHDSQLVSTVGK